MCKKGVAEERTHHVWTLILNPTTLMCDNLLLNHSLTRERSIKKSIRAQYKSYCLLTDKQLAFILLPADIDHAYRTVWI